MSWTLSRTLVLFFLILAFSLTVYGHADQASIGVKPVPPYVVSGGDLGFRITGMKGTTPVGTLVVRVGGEWVKVEWPTGPTLAGQ